MSKKIQDSALLIFILSIVILTVVAVLGIWDVFQDDVIYKSFTTIGILTFASLITVIAARAMNRDHDSMPGGPTNTNNFN
jgi:hypothetical protein